MKILITSEAGFIGSNLVAKKILGCKPEIILEKGNRNYFTTTFNSAFFTLLKGQ